jgi:hypothetical protein
MTDYFYKHQIRIFDYPKWAEPSRDSLRANREGIAAEGGIGIGFVRSRKSFRKEDRVKEILRSAENVRAWCASCLPWSRAAATSPGMTGRPTRRI